MNNAVWPKDKLLIIPPELPMEERIIRYQHNLHTIKGAGFQPASAMVDSFDEGDIRAWFEAGDQRIAKLKRVIRFLGSLPEEAFETADPLDDDDAPAMTAARDLVFGQMPSGGMDRSPSTTKSDEFKSIRAEIDGLIAQHFVPGYRPQITVKAYVCSGEITIRFPGEAVRPEGSQPSADRQSSSLA